MGRVLNLREHGRAIRQMAEWILLAAPIGAIVGSASALFLWALDQVTWLRWEHPWLLFFLPAGGLAIWLLYHHFGKSVEAGNNLIIDQIHTPGGGVPVRMAPLVLIGTLLTHLFGGSAGREGTAVQMGGSLANGFGRLLRLNPDNLPIVLMAGVAAGFGSVFGTPLTGAVFAMEVLIVGRIQYQALIPVLVASVTGDKVCAAWGIHHASYHIAMSAAAEPYAFLDAALLPKIVAASALFGLASLLFAELTHGLQNFWKRIVPWASLRPMVGGAVVIALVYLLGTREYLGIGVQAQSPGVNCLLSAFQPGGSTVWGWWWKLLFTAVTLSCGFKGGEVTPLFFIGAALGNTLALLLNAPVDLFAGLGFIGVFAAATNTPVACTLMGIELFGAHYATYFGIACFVAYFFSGRSGIYQSQRLGVPKIIRQELPPEVSLREAREWESGLESMNLARLADRWSFSKRFTKLNGSNSDQTMNTMNTNHDIASREMGKLHVYLKPRDRLPARGLWDRLSPRPLYRELIDTAKQDGIGTAVAYMTHYGFAAGGPVQSREPETGNSHLTLCVELIDSKDALETFCRRRGALLEGKTVIYKHVEHWHVHVAPELAFEQGYPAQVFGPEDGVLVGA